MSEASRGFTGCDRRERPGRFCEERWLSEAKPPDEVKSGMPPPGLRTAREDEENPVRYLATNKIDAPTAHVIRSYGMRGRIETFFEDSKQDLCLGDCEMQTAEGANRHWHRLVAAYSLVRLDSDSSALGTVRSKVSSLRAKLEHSPKETVYNLLSWVRNNDDRGVDDPMEEIDHLFVHSTADGNVQS